jgi:hypothetical protein
MAGYRRPLSVTPAPAEMLTRSRAAGLTLMLLNRAQALFRPSFTRNVLPSMYVVPLLPMIAALTIRGEVPRLTR